VRPFAGAAAKAALRADAMARRDAMSAGARAAGSAVIVDRALAIIEPLKPSVVAVYRAIRTEVVPDAIVDWALERGLVVVLPAIEDASTLVFRRYRPGDPLVPAGLGTVSPARDAPHIDPDVIVTPMVAFDRLGTRLGHGRGYYDRGILALHAKGLRPALVGVAFAVQEVAAIPSESHDIRMDWIVTENETIDLRHLG
jgi:5-formyltetrahydrofolate cyclo-ligase